MNNNKIYYNFVCVCASWNQYHLLQHFI